MAFLSEIDNLTTLLIQGGTMVTAVLGLALWVKRQINKGMVTKEEFDTKMDNADAAKGPPGIAQQIAKSIDETKAYTDTKLEEYSESDSKAFTVYKETQSEKEEKDTKWLNGLQLKFESFIQQVASHDTAISFLKERNQK